MNYESVLVMEPSLAVEGQKLFFQKLKKIIGGPFKGRIHHIDTWGARRLANKNKKNLARGIYFHFSFEGGKGVVEELVRVIRMDEKVLYCHFEKLSPKKSAGEHLQDFRDLMEEAVKREKERQIRLQKRKSFMAKKAGI